MTDEKVICKLPKALKLAQLRERNCESCVPVTIEKPREDDLAVARHSLHAVIHRGGNDDDDDVDGASVSVGRRGLAGWPAMGLPSLQTSCHLKPETKQTLIRLTQRSVH